MYLSNLIRDFSSLFKSSSFSETFVYFEIELYLLDYNWEPIEKTFCSLSTISPRDRFEFFLTIDSITKSVTTLNTEDKDNIQEHFKYFATDSPEEIKLKIAVHKEVVNKTISVYSLSSLQLFIAERRVATNSNNLATLFCGSLVFEVFDEIKNFGSHTIQFQSTKHFDLSNVSEILERELLQEKINNNSFTQGITLDFIPVDFRLINRSDLESINDFFDNICSMLSIFSIANNATISESDEVQFKLNGYRSIISQKRNFSDCCNCVSVSYKIHSWIYDKGDCGDKLGLARNVLSLHLNDQKEVQFNQSAVNAIESNYQIYLEKNITNYLEIKNKISECILESSSKMYELCDSFLNNFKSSITTFLTFFLTVVLVSGIKDNGVQAIFSPVFLWVVCILTVLSCVWLKLVHNDTNARFKHSCISIRETLNKNYNNVLVTGEVNEIIDPILELNTLYFNNQLKKYTTYWITFVTIFVLSFAIGWCLFYQEKKVLLKNSFDNSISREHKILHSTSPYPIVK